MLTMSLSVRVFELLLLGYGLLYMIMGHIIWFCICIITCGSWLFTCFVWVVLLVLHVVIGYVVILFYLPVWLPLFSPSHDHWCSGLRWRPLLYTLLTTHRVLARGSSYTSTSG